MNKMLEDNDLVYTQYPIDILIKNINRLSIKNLLYHQFLTAEFCAKYILSKNSTCCNEEEYITLNDVIEIQNHLTKEEIKKYM
jgi:hypothetical protein